MIAYLNIGSNLGNRRGNICEAVRGIEKLCQAPCRQSSFMESEPWGFQSSASFINIGVAVETSLSPLSLLHGLQQVERDICPAPHRDASGAYINRVIDIDIIALDSMVINAPELQVPHPRMHLRPFVLQPMACLAPDWVHPLLHLSAAQMLANLGFNKV